MNGGQVITLFIEIDQVDGYKPVVAKITEIQTNHKYELEFGSIINFTEWLNQFNK